ncbi:MAG TPA: hypothetical protein VIE69_05815 [Methylophilaceae bacterium]
MNKKFTFALLLGAALMWFASAAFAADFYVLYFSAEEETALLLDPSSVSETADHHKLAHIANISAFALWNDDAMEADCAGNRWKTVSSISHLGRGESIDHALDATEPPAWEPVTKGTMAWHEFDVMCRWPASKDKLELYQADDLPTAGKSISKMFSDQK